jgi:hypothetical protein
VTIAPKKGSDGFVMSLSKSSKNPSVDISMHNILKGSLDHSKTISTIKESTIVGFITNMSSYKFE